MGVECSSSWSPESVRVVSVCECGTRVQFNLWMVGGRETCPLVTGNSWPSVERWMMITSDYQFSMNCCPVKCRM